MDDADRVSEQEAMLEKLKAAARGYVHQEETADDCTMCGEQIPSARQLAIPGVQTCVDCQELCEWTGIKYGNE